MLDYLMVQEGYIYDTLYGTMDLDERIFAFEQFLITGTRRVDGFNTDPSMFVFLISTKAGGVGLNIVSANKVYLSPTLLK